MATSPLVYLQKQLNGQGDFMKSWSGLTDADKATLKTWATDEMKALGVE